jgi:transposase
MQVKQIDELREKIDALEKEINMRAAEDENAARLMSMPGIGPICAMAILAFAPPMESFRNGRDFAAWTGLTPRQNSTGGKQSLGKTSKMGQRDIRKLLIFGATVVVRWAARN